VKKKYQTHASKKGRDCTVLTPPRVKMATIPENAKPIPNPVGAAPAIRIDFDGTVLIALPGVPREMEAIFEENVAPLLKSASQGNRFYEESLYLDGIMESELAPLIEKVMQENPGIYVKSHPRGAEKKPHLEIHFSLTSPDHEPAQKRIHTAVSQFIDLITRILSPRRFTKADDETN
jgi:molybdopterin-biosynthesis enzyme MoeA-like protein